MTALAYYLLKVIICSGILFLYYHLALKNKAFHQWNRFYLLSAVILSLLLPLFQFTIWHSPEDESKAIQLILFVQSADQYLEEFAVSSPASVSPEQWLLLGYATVCFVLFLSLLLSLYKLFILIRTHTIQVFNNIKFVVTKEPGTPFSFLRFIFWNEDISLQSQTGQQIFQHELVHVEEKHTLDKLFIHANLILFWCNPFFWLIRRELKFIHEFIADKKAVGQHGTAAFAAMVMQATYPQHYHSITNQFFQTSIKRRLFMLTKIQNKKVAYISRIIALPVVAAIIFSFTVRTEPLQESARNIPGNLSKTGSGFEAILLQANDTLPKDKKEITAVDVSKNKDKKINRITITYSDGTSETLTEQEANSRGLIQNGGFGNQKNTAQKQITPSIIRLKPGAPKPLVILDGKEITDEEMNKVDPAMIQSVNVLKDKSAIDKYGLKGKNGVIEITMKKAPQLSGEISYDTNKHPAYFLDGKQITQADIKLLDMKTVESVNVLKNEVAIAKYGDKGKNGVVEITLKKTSGSDGLILKNNGKPVMSGEITKLEFKNDKSVKIEANLITIPDTPKISKPVLKN
jgi:hypothetical protein